MWGGIFSRNILIAWFYTKDRNKAMALFSTNGIGRGYYCGDGGSYCGGALRNVCKNIGSICMVEKALVW